MHVTKLNELVVVVGAIFCTTPSYTYMHIHVYPYIETGMYFTRPLYDTCRYLQGEQRTCKDSSDEKILQLNLLKFSPTNFLLVIVWSTFSIYHSRFGINKPLKIDSVAYR